MFKVKPVAGSTQGDRIRWKVIEENLDGTEENFGYFETKAKAELAASLLNACATVALA